MIIIARNAFYIKCIRAVQICCPDFMHIPVASKARDFRSGIKPSDLSRYHDRLLPKCYFRWFVVLSRFHPVAIGLANERIKKYRFSSTQMAFHP